MYSNEIELCELLDTQCSQQLDKALTDAHISFYFNWHSPIYLKPWSQFLKKGPEVIKVFVHDNDKQKAEDIVRAICDELGCKVKFTYRKVKKNLSGL